MTTLARTDTPAGTPLIVAIAGSGIDIVRMPTQPQPPGALPPSIVPAAPQPPLPAPPVPVAPPPPPPAAMIQPAQPLGRLVKLPVKIGSLPTDGRKGWLGVSSDPLELALALAIGLPNANGALIAEATAGGPAGLAGIRFGDIVVGYNGKTIDNMEELRQRVASTTPGVEAALEVWRIVTEDGDFLRTLHRLADGGNAAIMHRLGRMYSAGIGVARDDTEALRWFRKGAAAGNLNSTTMVAIALIEGRGTGKDPQEAVYLLKVAADKNSPEAMHRLGVLLVQGTIVGKDLPEAVRLLTKAADAAHVPATVDLGVLHQQGLGVPVNFNTAARLYKRGADLGNALGMMYLGTLHEQGKGVEQSDTAATALYRRAADLGHPFGLHNFGAMLDRGKGVARDPEQAADLVLRALALRNPFSYQQMTKNSHAWSAEFRRALQRRLRDAGVFEGRIDGAIRASTIAAIDAYVNRNQRQDTRQPAYGNASQPW